MKPNVHKAQDGLLRSKLTKKDKPINPRAKKIGKIKADRFCNRRGHKLVARSSFMDRITPKGRKKPTILACTRCPHTSVRMRRNV